MSAVRAIISPMRRLVLVLALPALLPSLACDSGGDDGGGDNGDILALMGDPARGEGIFAANMCSTAACHGADGSSGTAPDLRTVVPGLSDDQIIDAVLDGKAAMPPQSLDDQQMADVLAWLRDSF